MMLENTNDPDEWDTDPDFVNDISEKDQRWGSKAIQGSGRQGAVE
jgi:cortactin